MGYKGYKKEALCESKKNYYPQNLGVAEIIVCERDLVGT